MTDYDFELRLRADLRDLDEPAPAALRTSVIAIPDEVPTSLGRRLIPEWSAPAVLRMGPLTLATAAVIVIAAIWGVAYMATRPVRPDVGSSPRPSPLQTAVPQLMPAFHNNGAIVVIDAGLRAINPATGHAAKEIHLPDAPDASDATWSPDGRQLAYTAPGGLWVVDVSTGDSRKIANCGTERFACFLAWSPDGSRIAVARGMSQLELIDPGTGEVTRLETPAGTLQPTWSPDGRRIAFQAIQGFGGGDQQRRLYAINRDGSDLTLLLNSDAGSIGGWDPSWSPDGSTIAYIASTATVKDEWMLHVMLLELDGSEARELVEAGTCACLGYAPGLTWSPDGERMALNVPGNGTDAGLYLVNADGSGLHRVGNGVLTPAWRPVP